MQPTPFDLSFRQPAEWETHAACWLAWPSHENLWQEDLPYAQDEFVMLCRAISGVDYPSETRGVEPLQILVPTEDRKRQAENALRGIPCTFQLIPFGDIWLRDTAPIFVRTSDRPSQAASVKFGFNGWGEKYVLPHDGEVRDEIQRLSGLKAFSVPWVLEGGSVDVDGEGTCLTTRQCLLNPNRNPEMSEKQIEQELRAALGVEKTIWLDEGLLNDHTDGHIDTLARFVAPGKVACMTASGAADPNRQVYEAIYRTLSAATDYRGRKLDVTQVPSPGSLQNDEGRVMPASYMNFYISNRTVVVPNYGSRFDAAATKAIATCFPDRKTVGLSARAILSGGGAFHCITQQQPYAGN